MVIMATVIFRYQGEDSSSAPRLTFCPKCGRLVKINGHCESEDVFVSRRNKNQIKSRYKTKNTQIYSK